MQKRLLRSSLRDELAMTTAVLKVDPKSPDGYSISYAAALLASGALVAFPTETVYGLGANRASAGAMAALARAKNRPKGKAFTVHISSGKMVGRMGCRITPDAARLIKRYWPGPLTVILRSRSGDKIGFRMPANPIAIQLIEAAGVPVAAPSANLSGNRPPVSAKDVLREMAGRIDLVIDGGKTAVGIESTVVDLSVSPPVVLREGAIRAREIFKACRK